MSKLTKAQLEYELSNERASHYRTRLELEGMLPVAQSEFQELVRRVEDLEYMICRHEGKL